MVVILIYFVGRLLRGDESLLADGLTKPVATQYNSFTLAALSKNQVLQYSSRCRSIQRYLVVVKCDDRGMLVARGGVAARSREVDVWGGWRTIGKREHSSPSRLFLPFYSKHILTWPVGRSD